MTTTERYEERAGVRAETAAHLTVITSPTPAAVLAAELDLDVADIVDAAAFAAACERLARGRAEGYGIVRENIANETALVELARARLDARIDELSRRAEELEAAIGAVERGAGASVGIDLAPVREALVAYEAAQADPDGPDPEAIALADEFDAADALRAHLEREVDYPMLAAAEAELAEAREELAQVRESVGEIDPRLVARVNECHAVVEELVTKAEHGRRGERSAARQDLIAALDAERAALEACGFTAYATFLVQIAQGGNRPEDDAAIAAAQRRVTHAEAARRRAEALATVPHDEEWSEDDVERRARAAQLLGRMAGPDPAAELRALRSPRARLDAAVVEVDEALRAVGVAPGRDPLDAARRLLAAPPVHTVSNDVEALEAELSDIDDEGARAADEYDRLTARLDELDRQRAQVAAAPTLAPADLDADDAELLVRDLLDDNAELLVVVDAFDALSDEALERTLELLAGATGEVVLVSRAPVVALWARSIGAEVLDELPPTPPLQPVTPVAADPVPVVREIAAARPETRSDTRSEPAPPAAAPSAPEVDPVFALLADLEPDAEPEAEPEVVSESPRAPIPSPPAPMAKVTTRPAPPAVPHPDEIVPKPLTRAGEVQRQREAQQRARADRSQRRAQRRADREEKFVRRIASRFEHQSNLVGDPDGAPPWAHWDDAAAARRDVSDARAARLEAERQRHRDAARDTADRVETRTGATVGDRSQLHVCTFHRHTETRVRCVRCAHPFCDQCLVTVGPRRELICVECAVKAAGVRERRRR